MLKLSVIALALLTALPAVAQESGGIAMRNQQNTLSELGKIRANMTNGCPLSRTSVTVGVNKASQFGSSMQQQRSTTGGAAAGCQPLFDTQVVAGANLALGGNTTATQTLSAQGPRGVLGTTTFTRGYNVGLGRGSTANQTLLNQTGLNQIGR
jgi:hypothetical protein